MSTPRSPYHHGSLHQALLAAGRTLLEEQGLDGLTLRAVARLAGVSHAAPKRHFVDQADFLAALAAQGYRELAERLDAARLGPGEPLERLLAVGYAYVDFAMAESRVFGLMFHPLVAQQHAGLQQAAADAYSPFRAAIRDAQDAGGLAPIAADELALALWSLVHGLSVLAVDRQLGVKGYDAPPRDLFGIVAGVLYTGMGVPPVRGA
jgi:AcrR family transcriptional regulator